MNDLVHIYPPKTGGVLDYVDVYLAHQPNAVKIPLDEQSASSIILEGSCLLHYSGYGYAKRGAPLWLLKKIEEDRPKIKTLGIFFHELYAFGPPWGSAFWLSPAQRHIARRLAELSDYWITNREGSSTWLKQFASDKANSFLPIFSTVGEMDSYSPIRKPTVVIFGLPAVRANTYRAAGDKLFDWARCQGLEIHDIGSPILDESILATLKKNNVKLHGRLEAIEVSKILSNATFGLLKYPVEYVAKSTIFAAYCAHGICPILISDEHQIADGLVAGVHYHAGIPDHAIDEEKIGQAAMDWYQPHCISSHVSVQQKLLGEAIFRDN